MYKRLLIVWFASVLMLTLAPFGPWREPLPFSWMNPTDHPLGLFDFYANIALFLPLGVFFRQLGFTLRGTVLLGLALSMLIESTQAYIVVRSPSGWDLIANTMGTLLGAIWSHTLLRVVQTTGTRPVRIALLVAGTIGAMYLTKNYGFRARFFHMLPFVYGALGSLLIGSLISTPYLAATLCWGAVVVLCGPAVAPLDVLWLLCLTAGVVLGAWPFEGRAKTTAATPTPTVG